MITVDLRKEKHSIDELLSLAASETIIIYNKDGKHYILEETDDFEKEVEKLGNSKKFMEFLSERSEGKVSMPISSIAKKLGV